MAAHWLNWSAVSHCVVVCEYVLFLYVSCVSNLVVLYVGVLGVFSEERFCKNGKCWRAEISVKNGLDSGSVVAFFHPLLHICFHDVLSAAGFVVSG